MLVVFLDWLSINYYLTDKKLIEECEIIGKRIMFIPLGKVQDVICKFGVLWRIFGFWGFRDRICWNIWKIVFGFISRPRKRKEEINEAISKIGENRINIARKKAK